MQIDDVSRCIKKILLTKISRKKIDQNRGGSCCNREIVEMHYNYNLSLL